MKYLHENSPCCHGRVIKFGKRRRQCVICRKTYRKWKKKRGRKKNRVSETLFLKYLKNEISTLYSLSKSKNKNLDKLQRETRSGLRKFVEKNPWPQIPIDIPFIAVADAMMANISKKIYTFYFVLLRPVNDKEAIITEPLVREGTESKQGWSETFTRLEKYNKNSNIPLKHVILALVYDGNMGLMGIAKENNWIIQRCHFHILAKIQGRRSRWLRSRHRELGELLFQLARNVLTNPNEKSVLKSLEEIKKIKEKTNSIQLKKILSGFIKYYKDYRNYLLFPELNMPTTSNSAESLIGGLRKLYNRAHGFRTIGSMTLWTHALLKYRKKIACNGHLPTKLTP